MGKLDKIAYSNNIMKLFFRYTFVVLLGVYITSCMTWSSGKFNLKRIKSEAKIVANVYFLFEDSNRFEYKFYAGSTYRYSSGNYSINGKYIVLESDFDINSLPLEIISSELLENKTNKVAISIQCDFSTCENVFYFLIVNDSIEYKLKSTKDTVVVKEDIHKLQIKANIEKLFEPIKKIVNGKEIKYFVPYANMIFFSEVKHPVNADFHLLNFNLNYDMFNYETFFKDSFKIINKNTVKQLSSNRIYK